MIAETFLARLDAAYAPLADPERAAAMARYMRDRFPFLGVQAPHRRVAFRAAVAGLPAPADADLAAVAEACWDRPEREYQYAGVAYLRQHAGRAGAGVLRTAEHLITTKSWWDTVDELAAHVVGPLVARHGLRAEMQRWGEADDVWLARAAILHQLAYRERTDADLLFALCLRRAGEAEFFLRKGSGWALRQYARIDPVAVRRFVGEHDAQLSSLTKREALKHAGR